jgi:UDP-N-acetylmuramoylalanine--D-glutamate ligase
MKIAILGYGSEGKAAYNHWLSKPDTEITICDSSPALQVPDGVLSKLGDDYLKELSAFDLVVRSPGIQPSKIVESNGESILSRVTTGTNEFLKGCPTQNIIGVTGTKGKGTTSTLIAKMLESAGKKVHLGGNIGVAPISMLSVSISPDDWVVLELSSFQLIDIKSAPHIGVCLMVVPEHLDWHKDVNEYFDAKRQLFLMQTPRDIAIFYADNETSRDIASSSPGKKIPYYEEPGAIVSNNQISIDGQIICQTGELKLLGKHNWQNVCAAITCVWQVTQDVDAIRSVLTTFTGLEHRLELVKEIDGVKYYDDSFATTPESAIVAIEAFSSPKVLILGGSEKGANFHALAETVKDNDVRRVVVIGNTAQKIKSELETVGFKDITEGGQTIDEIVESARSTAQRGDVVLLSTGCASFGLFENYKDRGDKFKKAVQSLS